MCVRLVSFPRVGRPSAHTHIDPTKGRSEVSDGQWSPQRETRGTEIFTIGEQLWGCLVLETPLPCTHIHIHCKNTALVLQLGPWAKHR